MVSDREIEVLQVLIHDFNILANTYNQSDIEELYQESFFEAIDILDEIFGKNNKYSLNIINKSNAPYATNMYGSVSQEYLKDIYGILKASIKAAYRLKDKNIDYDKDPFVEQSRIDELSKISSDTFDLSKVITICNELNMAKKHKSFLSTILLIRALIDHVPPIFGLPNFNGVANQHGTKSFKDSMSHLNKSSRKIADSYLHTQIRKRESLPNFTQVNFSSDLDVLLGEIVRLLA
jgi:hypothetical protein